MEQVHAVVVLCPYSKPLPTYLQDSSQALRICWYRGPQKNITVINAKAIKSVVAMFPFPLKPEERSNPNTFAALKNCFVIGEKITSDTTISTEDDLIIWCLLFVCSLHIIEIPIYWISKYNTKHSFDREDYDDNSIEQ